MVAIKIQSLQDIAAAYLRNLGFEENQIANAVEILLGELGDNYDNDEVLASLDKLILKIANKIFENTALLPGQKVAMFKLGFLLNKGAQKWGAKALLEQGVSSEVMEAMRAKMMSVAPQYKFSRMQPQPIETAHGVFNNFFRKLLGNK